MNRRRHSFPELPSGLFRKKTSRKVRHSEPPKDPCTLSSYTNSPYSADPISIEPNSAHPNSATQSVTSDPRRCERSFSLPLDSLVSEKYLPNKDSQVSVPPPLQSISEALIEASPLTPCTPAGECKFQQIYNNGPLSLTPGKAAKEFKAPKQERPESPLYHVLESHRGSRRSEPLYEPVPDSVHRTTLTGRQRVKNLCNREKWSSEPQNYLDLPFTDCESGRVNSAGVGYRMPDGHEERLTQTIGGGRGSTKIVVFRRAVSYSGSRHADLENRKRLLDKRHIAKTTPTPTSSTTEAHSINSHNGNFKKNCKSSKLVSRPTIYSQASKELRKTQSVENIYDEVEPAAIPIHHPMQSNLYRQNAVEETFYHNSAKATKPSMGKRIVTIRTERRISDVPSPAREEPKAVASASRASNRWVDSYRSHSAAASERLNGSRETHKTRMWSSNDSPSSLSIKHSPLKLGVQTSINDQIPQAKFNTSTNREDTTHKLLRGNSFLESFADDEQTDHSDSENSNLTDTDSPSDDYEVIPAITQRIKTSIPMPKNLATRRHAARTSDRRASCPTLLQARANHCRYSSKPDPTTDFNSNKPTLKNKLCAVTSSSVLHPLLAPRRSSGNALSKDWLSTNDLITKSGSVSTFSRIIKALSGSMKSLRKGKSKRGDVGELEGKSADVRFSIGGDD